MKGLIIAAGRGKRLGSFTDNTPKPLVDIKGSSFFNNTVEQFKSIGITDIAAVIGYKKEQFKSFEDITFYENNDWECNNILHSMFSAKEFMDDDIIIAYADIWFEKTPFLKLKQLENDIVICVDKNWEDYYINRTEHPISEAENVHYDKNNNITHIGKHIYTPNSTECSTGEFMGLLKVSKNIIKKFVSEFEILENTLAKDQSFQNAEKFQNAYLTDFIQYLINKNYDIRCCLEDKGWAEIDTVQDLENLKKRI